MALDAPAGLTRPKDRFGLTAPFKAPHHIAVVTNDMAKTVAFYCDVLGAEVAMTHRMPRAGAERHYFVTIAENTVFAFFEFPDAELPEFRPPTQPKTGRFLDHIAFFVEDRAALEAWHAHLDGKVENRSDILDLDFVDAFFFSDPNGMVLEVMAEKPGMTFPKWHDGDPIPGLPKAEDTAGGGGRGL